MEQLIARLRKIAQAPSQYPAHALSGALEDAADVIEARLLPAGCTCIGGSAGCPVHDPIVDVEDEGDGMVSVDFADGRVEVMARDEVPGTEGQDRESYTDDQDRDSYTVPSYACGECQADISPFDGGEPGRHDSDCSQYVGLADPDAY